MSEAEWLDIFGDNLKEWMAEFGHDQKSLADAINVSEATVSRYINKQRMPSVKAIINLVYELNISFDELLDFGSRIE